MYTANQLRRAADLIERHGVEGVITVWLMGGAVVNVDRRDRLDRLPGEAKTIFGQHFVETTKQVDGVEFRHTSSFESRRIVDGWGVPPSEALAAVKALK